MKSVCIVDGDRLPARRTQEVAAEEWRAEKVWIDDIDEWIKELRPKDRAGMYRLSLMAPLGLKLTQRRRDALNARLDAIHAVPAVFVELETGRRSSVPTELQAMLDDAWRMLSTRRVYRDPRTRGRPKVHDYTPEQEARIMEIWNNAGVKTGDEKVAAIRKRMKLPQFNKTAAYRIAERQRTIE